MLAGWLESRLFLGVRIVLTLGTVWLLVQRIHLHSTGTGLTLEEFGHYGQALVTVALIGACVSLMWAGSLCDGLAGILIFLIDSPDDRPLRESLMDKLNRLVKAGHTRRARWLCRRMIWRREGSRMALEAIMLHLSERQETNAVSAVRPVRISGGK
jgi:hypothetical protein